MTEGRLPEKCGECGQLVEHRDDSPYVKGDLTLRPGHNDAAWRGQRVKLSPSEFATLMFIAKREIARKEALYTAVFEKEDGTPEPKIVDVIVCKIRAKLKGIGAEGILATRWGVGFALDLTNGSPAVPTGVMRRDAAANR